MTGFLDTYKFFVRGYLEDFFRSKSAETKDSLEKELFRDFGSFCLKGKFFRGSFLIWAYKAYGGKNTNDAIVAAASLEVFQSAVLVHDDVIDGDSVRRGQNAFHESFQEKGSKMGVRTDSSFGESMAICLGDIGFFTAYEILSGLKNHQKTNELFANFSRVFVSVGLGEMKDIILSSSLSEPDLDLITDMYQYKTSGYTFVLPLVAGAYLAGKENDRENLGKLGVFMGLIYQARDDYLGIFGDSEKTGKAEGGDISENKKTLYRQAFFNKTDERDPFRSFFGRKIKSSELDCLRKKIREAGVLQDVGEKIDYWEKESLGIIRKLGIGRNRKEELFSFVKYLKSRLS